MDQQIKERMVGAGVLVLAAVIFIPMLLSGPAPKHDRPASRTGDVSAGASGVDSARASAENGFSSRIVPLGAPSPAQNSARDVARQATPSPTSAKTADKSPARVGNSSESASAKPKEKPEPSAKVQPKLAPKPTPEAQAKPSATTKNVRKSIAPPSSTGTNGGWVVQLGSFSSARNAHALRDRLKSKGYKAFARSSGSGAQAVTRVYVGPDASREQAQQRVSRLFAETRLKGIVLRNPK